MTDKMARLHQAQGHPYWAARIGNWHTCIVGRPYCRGEEQRTERVKAKILGVCGESIRVCERSGEVHLIDPTCVES